MPRSRVGTFLYERVRCKPLDSKLMFYYCTKLMLNSYHEVGSELVTTNALDAHHWTLNSGFSVFRNVWVHWDHFAAALNSVQNGPYWCN